MPSLGEIVVGLGGPWMCAVFLPSVAALLPLPRGIAGTRAPFITDVVQVSFESENQP